MQLEHGFVVPVRPAQAWTVLMDIAQVALCMPGATLLEVDGDRFTGKVKIKVGPITVSYKGSAEFVERNEKDLRAVIRANAREERGAGTASVVVTATLVDAGDGSTRVQVVTDLDVTGKPAQFGRGVMEEVGTAIIGQFATRLARQIKQGDATPDSVSTTADDPVPSSSPTTSTAATAQAAQAGSVQLPPAYENDALDLGLMAWRPLARRLAPVGAGLVGLVILVMALRGRRTQPPPVTVVFAQLPPMRPDQY